MACLVEEVVDEHRSVPAKAQKKMEFTIGHICAGTRLTASHICAGLGLAAAHIFQAPEERRPRRATADEAKRALAPPGVHGEHGGRLLSGGTR